MIKKHLKKVIAIGIITTLVLALNSIGASASWRKNIDNTWSYDNAIEWKNIDGLWYYFNSNSVMQTGWLNDKENWYYLQSNGSMARNTTLLINGVNYSFNSYGSWINQVVSNSSNTNNIILNTNTNYTTKINTADKMTVFYEKDTLNIVGVLQGVQSLKFFSSITLTEAQEKYGFIVVDSRDCVFLNINPKYKIVKDFNGDVKLQKE